MIISRTPFRISFAGGGSDLPCFYRELEGAVLSTTINQYIYITAKKRFDRLIRLNYSKTELVERTSDIENDLARETLCQMGLRSSLEISSVADLPSGTGMGSSSSYLVGLLNSLSRLQGKTVTSKWLAEEACRIEIDCLRKKVGKQDQYAAVWGGFNFIRFLPNEDVVVEPIRCEVLLELEESLTLMYVGGERSANDIITHQSLDRTSICDLVALAWEMKKQLESNRLSEFGRLLHEAWVLKKKRNNVTNDYVDNCYQLARSNGASGGKLLGAGRAGFLLLYSDADAKQRLQNVLNNCIPVPIKFERTGSCIIYEENRK